MSLPVSRLMRRITALSDIQQLIKDCGRLGFLGYKSKYTLDSHVRGLLPDLRIYADLSPAPPGEPRSTAPTAQGSLWSKLLLAYPMDDEENLTTLAQSEDAARELVLDDIRLKRKDLFSIPLDRSLAFAGVDQMFREPVQALAASGGFRVKRHPCKMFHNLDMDKVSPGRYAALLPPNGVLGPLLESHAELVNRTWPYGTPGTLGFIRSIIRDHVTVALYIDDKPVCWCLVQPYGAMGMLYTVPEERRKNYGALVMMALTYTLLKNGHTPFLYVVSENKASLQLFTQSLSFEQMPREQDWIILKAPAPRSREAKL